MLQLLADGIGQRGDLPHALGHLGDALRRQRQPVDLGGGEFGFFRRGEVLGIGGEKGVRGGGQQFRQPGQRGVLPVRRRRGEHQRRGAGATGEGGHQPGKIGGHGPDKLNHEGPEGTQKFRPGCMPRRPGVAPSVEELAAAETP